jgi:hypothetical protein
MPIDNIPPDLLKEAVEKAMSEWLDRQWKRCTARLGSWVLCGIAATVFAGLVRYAINQNWTMR